MGLFDFLKGGSTEESFYKKDEDFDMKDGDVYPQKGPWIIDPNPEGKHRRPDNGGRGHLPEKPVSGYKPKSHL